MKRIIMVIFCVFMIILQTGCKRVVVTSSDELTMNTWVYSGENGVKSTLSFSGERAKLSIKTAQSSCTVEGVYSVDYENLYITDESKYKTYVFAYDVYADRVYISYGENTVCFTAKE